MKRYEAARKLKTSKILAQMTENQFYKVIYNYLKPTVRATLYV